jgi:AcrR family transcriptional regulator
MANSGEKSAPAVSKRRYVARTERAAGTKRRIVEVAHRLFVERGYLDTSVADIASEANVAVQTLYLGFGSKVNILSAALDRAVVGDDQPVAVLERPWVAALERQSDGVRAVALLVHEGRHIVERAAPIYFRIQESAAVVDVAELLSRQRQQQYTTFHALIEILSRKRGFDHSLGVDRGADIAYGLCGEDSYRLFCLERGWSADQWEQWSGALLCNAYYPEVEHPPRQSDGSPTATRVAPARSHGPEHNPRR